MVWASEFALPLIIFAIVCQWWTRVERSRVRHAIVATVIPFLAGLGLNQFILLFVHRIRPHDFGVTHLLISPSADFSMPSDHPTACFAIASAMLFHGLRGRGALLFGTAILVCVARVYVGTHYVSDVSVGALIGVLAAKVVQASYLPGTRLDKLLISIL